MWESVQSVIDDAIDQWHSWLHACVNALWSWIYIKNVCLWHLSFHKVV